MITDKSFTFGFELEGIFRNGISGKLGEKVDCYFKEDSSVDVSNFHDWYLEEAEAGEDNYAQEVNVGVFGSVKEMLKYLDIFKNNKNFLSNETCGLHIHIKPKKRDLRDMIFDRDFIVKLQRYAELLCPETRKRIIDRKGGHFCECKYTNGQLLRDYQGKTKYIFMRNHPQGTIEFRFFSACEHKTENVKRFFEYFLEELNRMTAVVKKRFSLKPEVKLEYKITPFHIERPKVENQTEKIKSNIKLNICV